MLMPRRDQAGQREQLHGAPNGLPSRLLLFLLAIGQLVIALTPLGVAAILYAMSWRAEAAIGHWPQPYSDDPKFILMDDAFYGFLYSSVCIVGNMSCISFLALPMLSFAVHTIFKPRIAWTVAVMGIYGLGWLFLILGTADRLTWYMD